MSGKLLSLYHRLPPVGRNMAATLRGYELRYWRYGPETEALVAEALERGSWSAEQWQNFQEERLAYVLHRAVTQVPYYREQWAERRRKGDRAAWEYLENWPVLEKEMLRQQPLAFIADDCDPRGMYHIRTSGTTGKPLDIWWSRQTARAYYAIFEARLRRWNNVSRHQNWAIIGGQVVVPADQQKPPFWVWNSALNQLYLSANHISERNAPAYLDAIKKYRITHMIVYTSSAVFLAQHAIDFKQQLQVIFTNAEPLFPWQRQTLEQGFQCNVRETYGMAEMVAAASEDHHGKLRRWPEVGTIEVVEDQGEKTLPEDEAGRFVCTSLLNADMPLIRYAVGDRGTLASETPDANARIQLPMMGRIEGRNNDMLVAKDGRQVFWINPVFYGLPVVEAQVIQENLDLVRVLYVPSASFSIATEDTISQRLRQRLGDIQLVFERVTMIPRAPNGKFRAVMNMVSEDELKRVRNSD